MTPDASPSPAVRFLRRRWPWLVATPVATAALAGVFVFLVTPRFEASTTLRLVEEESALGGALTSGGQGSTGGGLSVLATLTGRGVPLQTEMAVLGGRGMTEEVVEEMGLRLDVVEPKRVARSTVLSQVQLPLDGPEGRLELRRQRDGAFLVTGTLLEARDPFRVVRGERYRRVELGTVAQGNVIPVEGAQLVLAPGAGDHERIVLVLLPRDRALQRFEGARGVSRPQREADLIQVSVTWTDPEVAADVANRLVDGYLEYREERRVERSRLAAEFLRGQVDSVAVELVGAEEALRRFREARDVVAHETQVSAEVTRLAELKGRRDLLRAERQALARLAEGLGREEGGRDRTLAFFPTLLQSQATSELLRLLVELENQRAALLERRTGDATQVRLLTGRIEAIEEELGTAVRTYLRGLDDQVAALDDALEGFEGQLAGVPAVEMEYTRLRRQVELLTELAAFLEIRRTEAELNAAKEGLGAYVLARARPAQEPATPRPVLIMAMALLVGVVLGIGGALAVEQVAPASEP